MFNTHTSRWLCLLTSFLLVNICIAATFPNPGVLARLKGASTAASGTAWIANSPATAAHPGFSGCVGLHGTNDTGSAISVVKLRLYVMSGNDDTVTISIKAVTASPPSFGSTLATANLNTSGLSVGWHEVTATGTIPANSEFVLVRSTTGDDQWNNLWTPSENESIAKIIQEFYSSDCTSDLNFGGNGGQCYSGVDFKYE